MEFRGNSLEAFRRDVILDPTFNGKKSGFSPRAHVHAFNCNLVNVI